MRARSLIGIAASLAAVALMLTVPAPTTAAWTHAGRFTAQSNVHPTPPPVDPPPVEPPPPVDPPVEPPVDPPVQPPVDPPVQPPPVNPSTGPLVPDEGTTISNVAWSIPAVNNQANTCVTFDVSSGAGGWSMSFMRNQAPLWGAYNVWTSTGGLQRTTEDDRLTFASANPVTGLQLCMNPGANPPVAEDRFTTTVTAPAWDDSGSDLGVCFAVTVAGRQDVAAYPFFFGWRAVLDLRVVNAMFQAAGRTPTNLVVASVGGAFQSSGWALGTEEVTLTSTTAGSIRGTQERVIDVCLDG